MKTYTHLLFSLFLIGLFAYSCKDQKPNNKPSSAHADTTEILKILPDSMQITAELSYENLQIFVIEGKAKIQNKHYTTLGEAMKKRHVKVIETGNVNELAITNLSEEYIFIHSGDIVKGGRQDRTISYDVIVPPNAEGFPLKCFCVESNRWSKRGEEADGVFSENKNIISSRKLKIASKGNSNQAEVWDKVADQQVSINSNMAYFSSTADVTANASATSLELTLENTVLDSIRDCYKAELMSIIRDYPNAVGFAYAINGEVYGIELYNNTELFSDLWEKLLNASIVESISELEEDSTFAPSTSKEVYRLVQMTLKGASSEKQINKETMLQTWTQRESMLFVTIDTEADKWLHKNYIAIDTTEINIANKRGQQLEYDNSNVVINLDEYLEED